MPAVRVGEPFDVVEEGEPRGVAGGEALASQHRARKRTEEALRQGIVEAVTAAAHRAEQPGLPQTLPECQARGPSLLARSDEWRLGSAASVRSQK